MLQVIRRWATGGRVKERHEEEERPDSFLERYGMAAGNAAQRPGSEVPDETKLDRIKRRVRKIDPRSDAVGCSKVLIRVKVRRCRV